jgi:hypothetical protein
MGLRNNNHRPDFGTPPSPGWCGCVDVYLMIVPTVLLDQSMPGLLEVGMARGICAAGAWVLRYATLQSGRSLSVSAGDAATFNG